MDSQSGGSRYGAHCTGQGSGLDGRKSQGLPRSRGRLVKSSPTSHAMSTFNIILPSILLSPKLSLPFRLSHYKERR